LIDGLLRNPHLSARFARRHFSFFRQMRKHGLPNSALAASRLVGFSSLLKCAGCERTARAERQIIAASQGRMFHSQTAAFPQKANREARWQARSGVRAR